MQGFSANTQKAPGKLGQGGHPMASRARDCSLEGQTAQAQSAWLCFDGVTRVQGEALTTRRPRSDWMTGRPRGWERCSRFRNEQGVYRSVAFPSELTQRKDQQIQGPKSQAEGRGPCLGCWEPQEGCDKGRRCRKTLWRRVGMDWKPGGWGGGCVRVPVGEGEACIGAGATGAGAGAGPRGSRAGGLMNCAQQDLPITEWCLHTVGI